MHTDLRRRTKEETCSLNTSLKGIRTHIQEIDHRSPLPFLSYRTESSQTRPRDPTVLKKQIVRTTASQTSVLDPRRFPVEEPQPTTNTSDNTRNILQERRLTGHRFRNTGEVTRESICRVRARFRPVGLSNDDAFSPRGCHIRKTSFETCESGLAVVERVV
jgi:hypothetical protein